jgi:ORF6N domain
MTVPMERVEHRILFIRGHRVILDADLAEVYGVPTKALNQAIKRNAERFPEDFMFQLSREEADSLRSQTVTLKTVRGQHRKYLPYVFTEHGAIMAASVLNSPRAIEASVYVVRAFVKMREAMSSDRGFARRLDSLERKYAVHDVQIKGIFDAIRALMEPPAKPRRRIGY